MRSIRHSATRTVTATGLMGALLSIAPTAVLASVTVLVATGCSLAKRDSAELVNEGDGVKGSNLDEAISKYDQAATLDPTNRIALWKLALAYHKKEDWSKDAVTCAKAGEHRAHVRELQLRARIRARAGRGEGADELGRGEGAAPAGDREGPEHGPGLRGARRGRLHMDDEQGALQNYTKAIEIKPDELQYYPPLADLYSVSGTRTGPSKCSGRRWLREARRQASLRRPLVHRQHR